MARLEEEVAQLTQKLDTPSRAMQMQMQTPGSANMNAHAHAQHMPWPRSHDSGLNPTGVHSARDAMAGGGGGEVGGEVGGEGVEGDGLLSELGAAGALAGSLASAAGQVPDKQLLYMSHLHGDVAELQQQKAQLLRRLVKS